MEFGGTSNDGFVGGTEPWSWSPEPCNVRLILGELIELLEAEAE